MGSASSSRALRPPPPSFVRAEGRRLRAQRSPYILHGGSPHPHGAGAHAINDSNSNSNSNSTAANEALPGSSSNNKGKERDLRLCSIAELEDMRARTSALLSNS